MYQIRFIAKSGHIVADPVLGLAWAGNEVKDIADKVDAEGLLYYTDSFVDARSKKKREADVLVPREKPLMFKRDKDDVIPMIDVHRMNEPALQLYSQKMFNKTLDRAPITVQRQQLNRMIARANL